MPRFILYSILEGKVMGNDKLMALGVAVYAAAFFLIWLVGGWKLVAGIFLFGWGMNIDKRIKS